MDLKEKVRYEDTRWIKLAEESPKTEPCEHVM
jgi:hypothetical protein